MNRRPIGYYVHHHGAATVPAPMPSLPLPIGRSSCSAPGSAALGSTARRPSGLRPLRWAGLRRLPPGRASLCAPRSRGRAGARRGDGRLDRDRAAGADGRRRIGGSGDGRQAGVCSDRLRTPQRRARRCRASRRLSRGVGAARPVPPCIGCSCDARLGARQDPVSARHHRRGVRWHADRSPYSGGVRARRRGGRRRHAGRCRPCLPAMGVAGHRPSNHARRYPRQPRVRGLGRRARA